MLITCIGEVLIDFLPIEESGKTIGFHMHAGGSLLNVAVAAARLEQPVALATRVANDFFGRFLRDYAEQEGIDTRWLIDTPAQSTLAFVAHEGGEPVFHFYGEGTADALLTTSDLPDALFAESNVLHVGSISLLRGTTPLAVLDAVERMHGKALISLDPNIRPGLVHDEPSYRELLAGLFSLADLVKISAADLGWLAPGQELGQVAANILAQGPALVVITQGGAGVLALRDGADGVEELRLPAFQITVADTVGAGDSFNAGLLTALVQAGVSDRNSLVALPSETLREALRFAAAVAALNCTQPGANPPNRRAVEAFLANP